MEDGRTGEFVRQLKGGPSVLPLMNLFSSPFLSSSQTRFSKSSLEEKL
uniref:Uncharacterized protein n=1 Tax=Rhizophora mucronata TaxID=61149 RepID=A0A2P2PMU3_RHIMU